MVECLTRNGFALNTGTTVDSVFYFTYVKGNVRVRYSPVYRNGTGDFKVLAGHLSTDDYGYLVISVRSLQAIIDWMLKMFN